MMTNKIVVVFVHGWSVTNIDTYGGLPDRLSAEAKLWESIFNLRKFSSAAISASTMKYASVIFPEHLALQLKINYPAS